MTFVQGPEIWLNELGISLPCVVAPDREAVLDVAHRRFVNYEAYYLSTEDALQTFDQAPWRYTGLVTDPVGRKRFQPNGNSPATSHAGRLFYFSSPDAAATFAADPETFATPVVPYAGRM